jgi:hypothetical protein
MVLFCHTALINWQSPGELIIPAGRGKKLASAENGKSNAQFQLQFESRMDANEKLARGDPAIPASRGWSKFEMKLRLEEWVS